MKLPEKALSYRRDHTVAVKPPFETRVCDYLAVDESRSEMFNILHHWIENEVREHTRQMLENTIEIQVSEVIDFEGGMAESTITWHRTSN